MERRTIGRDGAYSDVSKKRQRPSVMPEGYQSKMKQVNKQRKLLQELAPRSQPHPFRPFRQRGGQQNSRGRPPRYLRNNRGGDPFETPTPSSNNNNNNNTPQPLNNPYSGRGRGRGDPRRGGPPFPHSKWQRK